MNFYRSYQRLMLIGRLGQDARLVQTKSGGEMLAFSVATTESVRNQDGSYEQRTCWHDCLMFGSRAQKLVALLVTGTLVSVEAHLSYRQVEVGGRKISIASIFVDDVQLLAGPVRRSVEETVPAPAVSDEPAVVEPPAFEAPASRPATAKKTARSAASTPGSNRTRAAGRRMPAARPETGDFV